MLKFLHPEICAWDAEWVPDVATGRRAYHCAESVSDEVVRELMYAHAGATVEHPRPYLKTALCRVVSVAWVLTNAKGEATVGSLIGEESKIIGGFLASVGKKHPQLVGFNSVSADLPILIQRAAAHRLSVPAFCHRPSKPWEGRDYFVKYSDWHIDLKEEFGGFGKSTPSLHELASAFDIPGKADVDGGDVLDLWLAGDLDTIRRYNEQDAIRTYLVFLRLALLSGLMPVETFERMDAEGRALYAERLEVAPC